MNKKYDSDFTEFCQGDGHNVTKSIDESVLNYIAEDLNPNWVVVTGKLMSIQATVGILTLLFCPQFELSLTANDEIYHFFHRHLGPYGCMAVCGAIFMGSGALLAGITLRLSELSLILKSKYLFGFSLSGLAVLMFLIAGADIYLSYASFWVLGGCLATVSNIAAGKYLRFILTNLDSKALGG